jgi:hypothetical protein
MGSKRKLYKKMRHIHLRFLDNGADCDLSQVLEWLHLAIEQDEPLGKDFVLELARIAATCEMEYRPELERLLEKALKLNQD